MLLLKAEDLWMKYPGPGGGVDAVKGINLEVAKGEFLAIIGPSGSGKSSLLYLLSALRRPTQGEVLFRGTPFSSLGHGERSRLRYEKFGFVFQQHFLINYLTAVENVALMVPPLRDTTAAGRRKRALDLLQTVGFDGRTANSFPHQLSVGQRQRVAVARALANSPEVVFADEPTASLDRANARAVMDLLSGNRSNASLIVVTHDREILKGANRIVEIRDGGMLREA